MLYSYQFFLPGITCINCVKPIEETLYACKKLKIISLSTDVMEKQITIVAQNDEVTKEEIQKMLREEIENLGIDCVELKVEQVKSQAQVSHEKNKFDESAAITAKAATAATLALKKKLQRNYLIKGIVGLLVGLALLILSLIGFALPFIAMVVITLVGSVLALILGARTYFEALKKLIKTKTLTMDALFTLSSLAAIAVSIAALFVPGLPMMLDAAILIFGFRYIGRVIEASAKNKILGGLSFNQRTPVKCEKVVLGNVEEIDTTSIQVGDCIVVRRGQVIPLNGECLDASASVYDTLLTGRTLPQKMLRGRALLAGMRIDEAGQDLRLRVTATQENSYLSRLDADIQQAQQEKAPLETAATKVLGYFIPVLLVVAIVLGVILGLLFPPTIAIQCVIALLVSACPCTLGLIVPAAIKVGMAKAADNGVHFKNGKRLQAAEKIDTVVFDLNGTLTTGVLAVTEIDFDKSIMSDQELLACLSALETGSTHPIAQALCRYANLKKTDLPIPEMNMTEQDFTFHAGVKAKLNGESYVLGNAEMMQSSGVNLPAQTTQLVGASQVIYLARDKSIIATIKLQDTLRDEALAVVRGLKKFGKQVHLCTGADEITAQHYARQLEISAEYVRSNCSPTDGAQSKLAYIKSLQAQGCCVAMVGDAGNDAASIEQSQVGIAIRSCASDEVTLQHAGAVIESLSLMPVLTAFVVAKETVSNIKQNLGLSLSYNIIMMLAAGGLLLLAGFVLNPAIGVALMIVQACLVLLNVYRLKVSKMPHLVAVENKTVEPVVGEAQVQSAQTYATVLAVLSEKELTNIEPNPVLSNVGWAGRPNSVAQQPLLFRESCLRMTPLGLPAQPTLDSTRASAQPS